MNSDQGSFVVSAKFREEDSYWCWRSSGKYIYTFTYHIYTRLGEVFCFIINFQTFEHYVKSWCSHRNGPYQHTFSEQTLTLFHLCPCWSGWSHKSCLDDWSQSCMTQPQDRTDTPSSTVDARRETVSLSRLWNFCTRTLRLRGFYWLTVSPWPSHEHMTWPILVSFQEGFLEKASLMDSGMPCPKH